MARDPLVHKARLMCRKFLAVLEVLAVFSSVGRVTAVVSTLAWVDTSAKDQRVIRDLIAQFMQHESRDELGIGQVRDVLSDALFPGTSVIQTRARYFLFVPWIFRQGERTGRYGAELRRWTEVRERQLVASLLNVAGDAEGLIGRRAGPAVKILPSTIYWSGLARYRILTRDVAADQLPRIKNDYDEAEELAGRAGGNWHPTLPPEPAKFPRDIENAFDLTGAEASWLRERLLTATPGTLLSHLLSQPGPPDADSPQPWADSLCARVPEPVRAVLLHAQLFSLAMHGAALLYNMLVGECYERSGHTRVVQPARDYRDRLASWHQECAGSASLLTRWDRDAFWDLVLAGNPGIGRRTRAFVDRWLDAVCGGRTGAAADDDGLRLLIGNRERQQKGAQSRLANSRLLRTWSGASGTAPLTYRWYRVHRIVTDIHDGLVRGAGS